VGAVGVHDTHQLPPHQRVFGRALQGDDRAHRGAVALDDPLGAQGRQGHGGALSLGLAWEREREGEREGERERGRRRERGNQKRGPWLNCSVAAVEDLHESSKVQPKFEHMHNSRVFKRKCVVTETIRQLEIQATEEKDGPQTRIRGGRVALRQRESIASS